MNNLQFCLARLATHNIMLLLLLLLLCATEYIHIVHAIFQQQNHFTIYEFWNK